MQMRYTNEIQNAHEENAGRIDGQHNNLKENYCGNSLEFLHQMYFKDSIFRITVQGMYDCRIISDRRYLI